MFMYIYTIRYMGKLIDYKVIIGLSVYLKEIAIDLQRGLVKRKS